MERNRLTHGLKHSAFSGQTKNEMLPTRSKSGSLGPRFHVRLGADSISIRFNPNEQEATLFYNADKLREKAHPSAGFSA